MGKTPENYTSENCCFYSNCFASTKYVKMSRVYHAQLDKVKLCITCSCMQCIHISLELKHIKSVINIEGVTNTQMCHDHKNV